MPHTKVIILFFLLFCLNSCNLIDPSVSESGKFELSVLDTSSKEIYLRIKTGDRFRNEDITLRRNGFSVMRLRASRDTVVCDTLLSPNTKYTYQVTESEGLGFKKHSEKVIATTLSPTSHNVSWQIYYIGEAGFDEARDVAVIDENNIWVSGNFTRNESDGEKYYNLVKRDGVKWTDDAALYKGSIYGVLYSIFAFSKSDIWVGNNTPSVWNGKRWMDYGTDEGYPATHTWIRKIWGTSSSDMYLAGENGSIVKYNGKDWKLLNQGSDAFIADIWGYKDELTGEETVYCPYSVSAEFLKILRISGNDQVDLINLDKGIVPYTVWTNKGNPLFVGGSGVFYNRSGKWTNAGLVTDKFINRIRGNGLNDIFAAGDFGLMAHYNGTDWKTYPELDEVWGTIRSIDVKGNTIAAVGILQGHVTVVIGKRN